LAVIGPSRLEDAKLLALLVFSKSLAFCNNGSCCGGVKDIKYKIIKYGMSIGYKNKKWRKKGTIQGNGNIKRIKKIIS